MHILIIAPEQIPVPPVLGGSVEVCILSIARQMAKNVHVTIISRMHPKYKRIHIERNLKIIRVPSQGEMSYVRAVLLAMKGKSFDWIQVDNRPYIASIIKRHYPEVPVSIFLHSTTFVTPPYQSVSDAGRLLQKVELIVTNSLSTKQECTRLFPQFSSKMRTVLLGVNAKRFRPPSSKEKIHLRKKFQVDEGYNVLFVGRLIPWKGVSQLIRAMSVARKQCAKLKLIVVGGAQRQGYLSHLKQLAKSYHVPILFSGKLPHRHVHRTYWLGDCLVCPSQKPEPFGLVNVEAMASGLPVIGSNNGGIPEIIRNGKNGLLVDAFHDEREIARHISKLANHPTLSRKLGRQARIDAIRRFSWRRTADELLSIYRSKKHNVRGRKYRRCVDIS